MSERYKEFLQWLKSDNVVKIGPNQYVEQVSQYRKVFTRKTLWKDCLRQGYFQNY